MTCITLPHWHPPTARIKLPRIQTSGDSAPAGIDAFENRRTVGRSRWACTLTIQAITMEDDARVSPSLAGFNNGRKAPNKNEI